MDSKHVMCQINDHGGHDDDGSDDNDDNDNNDYDDDTVKRPNY